MTIIIKRRRRKESRFEKAISAARRVGAKNVAGFREMLRELDKKENRLKAAAIKRYAKKHCLELFFHRKPWVFRAQNGEKVDMPAGYHAWANDVLQNVVVE